MHGKGKFEWKDGKTYDGILILSCTFIYKYYYH